LYFIVFVIGQLVDNFISQPKIFSVQQLKQNIRIVLIGSAGPLFNIIKISSHFRN